MTEKSLYDRLGGYDAITAVVNNFRACKPMPNWGGFGRTGVTMLSSAKSNY